MNPADFLLDLANGNMNDIYVPFELDDRYLVEVCTTNIAEETKKRLTIRTSADQDNKSQSMNQKWGASWGEQYSILLRRGFKERRHDYLSWLRITQVIATAVVLGLLLWQTNVHSPKDLKNQADLLFFIAVFWAFFPVFTAIFTFPLERAMLNKERATNMHRLSAYFMARTTSDLPLDLLLPLLFISIVYFMVGLRASAKSFFLTMLTVFLCVVAAQCPLLTCQSMSILNIFLKHIS
ncbi:hypothetical protein OSB04_009597 [Centaurea solstitialis]|uniref:ABC-2 type transporter transmembrane domain-containing protein n=1 Tax=Centaurea solstitialis TaxID=347529 RepID=A0AA38T5Y5_9ASTR|nr:hypothetical protein OSB04_009597 [Centaurea solstitialis]